TVAQGSEQVHRLAGCQASELDRLGAGGDEQGAVRLRGSVVENEPAAFRIDALHSGAEPELDALLGVEVGRTQGNPFLGRITGQTVLGEIRAVIGPTRPRLGVGDGPLVALVPQRLRGEVSGCAAPDDDDRLGMRARRSTHRLRNRGFPAGHPDDAIRFDDAPAADAVEPRRAHQRTRAQVEGRVVPGAANRSAGYDSLGERPAVMGAFGPDCERFPPVPSEEHRFRADVAQEESTFGQLGSRYTVPEIGTGNTTFVL